MWIIKLKYLIFFIVVLWKGLTSCQAQTNSGCGAATSISTVPFNRNLNNIGATTTFSDLACDIETSSQSFWLSYTPTENVLARATVSSQTFFANLAIFSGNCGSLNCLGATSYSSFSNRELYWAATAGTTYFIVITDQFNDSGSFNFKLEAPGDNQDTCTEALDVSSSLPYIKDESNANAYPGFTDLSCSVNDNSLGRWYKLTLATDSIARATVSNQDVSLGIAIFTGSCSSLTCFSNTSTSSFSNRVLTWAAAASTTYYILVFGSDFNQAGDFRIRIETLARPANDQCSTALDVTATLPYISVDSNTAAYPGFTDVVCGVDSDSRGVWYKVSPTQDTIARISVKNQQFDVGIAVYDSCQDMVCRGEQSFTSSFSDRSYTWPASGGSTYYLLVYGSTFSEDGTYQVTIEFLAAPSNDECGSALDVSPSLPYVSVDSNTAAFPSKTDVVCGVDSFSRGVWYRITPTENKIARITVKNQQFDAGIAVYDNCQQNICRGELSPTSSFSDRFFTWPVFAASTYYMLVYGSEFAEDGTYQVTVEELPTPSNDKCSSAIDVTSSLPYVSAGSNTGSFPSFADVVCGVDGDARGLWYKITPASNDEITMRVSGQNFDVGIAVYGGSCQATPCLGGESFTSSFSDRVKTWSAAAGTTYYMLVYGNGFAEDGNFQVRIESTGPASTTPAPIPAPTAPQPTISAPMPTPTAPVPAPSAPVGQPPSAPVGQTPSAPVGQTPSMPVGLSPISGPISVTPPTPDGGGGGFFDFLNGLCFSGSNSVLVQGKGNSRMHDIKIGDYVQVVQTNNHDNVPVFSPIISFSHNDDSTEAEFLQIYTTRGQQNNFPPLEISHDHIVVKENAKMVRAKDIEVGDILDGGLVVSRINAIKRRGLYAPVTAAGTIVVSGVTSSSYIAMLDSIPVIAQHYGAHALHFPLRLLCGYGLDFKYSCKEEEYTDGVSTYVLPIVKVVLKLRSYPAMVQVLAAIILAPFVSFIVAAEQVTFKFPSLLFAFVVATLWFVNTNAKNRKSLSY